MVVKRTRGRRRAGRNQRVTTTAVRKAIKQYPRDAGASERNIYRLVNKLGRTRRRKSKGKVRGAIQRAIAKGMVRPTKGWTGFRNMNQKRGGYRHLKGPRGRSKRGRPPHRGTVRSLGYHRGRSRGRSRVKNGRRGTASRGRSRGRPAKAGPMEEEETASLWQLSRCTIQ